MMEDIRKVLEAVAKGEITPEEGERLIKALKEREEEGEKKRGKKENEKKTFEIGKDEVVDGELILSGERVSIDGKLLGDAILMNCTTEFSGEIDGDMVLIGGKATFNGGKVNGDLVLIGVRYTGTEPEVKGEYVKVTNFFVNGIITALSPLLSGLRVHGMSFKDGKKIHVGSGMRNVVVPKGSSVSMVTVDCKKLSVHGRFESNDVSTENSVIYGEAFVDRFKSEKLLVAYGGTLKAKILKSEKITCEGFIESESVKAELIVVKRDGVLKSDHIRCEKITGNGRVDAQTIEADHIDEKLDLSLRR